MIPIAFERVAAKKRAREKIELYKDGFIGIMKTIWI